MNWLKLRHTSRSRRSQKWASLALVLALLGVYPAWAGAAPAAQDDQIGPNLLVDGDFEAPPTWPMQDGIGEIQVAPGWRAWYLDLPPSYVAPPGSCYTSNGGQKDNGCFWMRPEFRDTIRQSHANRIHSGERAQKYFSYGRMHEAGLLQQVNNVPVGVKLRFSIHIQAWMCSDIGACKHGLLSDHPSDMHLRVGIDPTGGTNPFSPNIVWSYEVPAWDTWVRFQVEAVAQSSTVTVFTHSRPEWDWARMNNDVYLDDAELVTVGPIPTPEPTPVPTGEQAPPPPPPPQTQPENTIQTQSTTRTDGTHVHVVSYGDTLLGIALAYGVTVDNIVAWNNLNPGDFLQIGQELVISVPPGWTPPQSASNPPAAPEPTATPVPAGGQAAPPASSPAGLCVVAFDDQNMNTLYDNNEQPVVGAQFDVLNGATVVQSHLTDGTEPYCFADLAPGTYTVAAKPANGYQATSVEKIGVAVAAGQTVNVAFGSVSTGNPAGGSGGNTSGSPLLGAAVAKSDSPDFLSQVGGVLISTSGLLVLLVAGVIGAVMSRRH
ncbi:MAG: LysM peptidoglycan-binding domain-containing protein [Thermoflexales bacterium]|nr:LysM peptidoglycan-binding domain-containing protein [Thermoflexales bacterium]